MLEFIQLLNQRYQAMMTHQKSDDPNNALFKQRLEQLVLTESFVKKGELTASGTDTVLHIAVIGPTQAGKSTVTNLMLDNNIAGVSPLAGYTVHSQGFCCKITPQDCSGLQNYFGRFQQLTQSELNNERYDCYSLTENASQSLSLPACVLWDTPDFDSIDSIDYREGMIRTIALADIIVLVVSKEKYADQSVWDMMAMIETFHQPTLICVNKLLEGTEDIIIQSLKEKWSSVRKDKFPDVIPLYYQKQTAMPIWPDSVNEPFFQLAKKVSQAKHFEYQAALINKYWHDWLEPIVAEHEANRLWRLLVEQQIEQALQAYQRDYLNHPHHYDTFQNALIELLNLLEIPGISKVLSKTRRVLTWPIRKIMDLGKKITLPTNQEETLLNQIGEHCLISFSEQLLEKIDADTQQSAWWKGCYGLLRQQRNKIKHEFEIAVEEYCINFQQDVEATANRLYAKLSEQPLILNSLRATRVTTDITAMAMVIHTAGIGIHDLVITPAMLAVTSLLTESAIGGYIGTVEAELKQQQLKTVKNDVLIACLQQSLYSLPEQLTDKSLFNISPALLQNVEVQRKK